MKTNIYVIYGGKSVEHEVSLKSASAVINSLDKSKYNIYPIYITIDGIWCPLGLFEGKIENPDELRKTSSSTVSESIGDFLLNQIKDNEKSIVFPALHGTNGEDGTIQGLLELLNIPYVGNGVLSSAVGMDKVMMKDIFAKHNIPQVKYASIQMPSWKKDKNKIYTEIEKKLDYPYYVKPANLGSSVGINRAENREEFEKAVEEAFLYDSKVIIEEEIIAREMQISIVGNDNPKASVPGEFIMERPFFDYEAKYIDGKLIPVIPAKLEPEVSDKVRETAVETFKILNCHGLARVDIFVTDDNKIYVNEVNTMPGFTAVSMTPVLWGATDGTTYAGLVEILIQLAFEKHEEKNNLLNTRS